MNSKAAQPSVRAVYLALAAAIALFFAAIAAAPAKAADETEVFGTGISQVGQDTRKLTVHAETAGAATSAAGFVQFNHLSPNGLSRFRGSVTCLSVDETGTVQISGSVLKGITASGVVLTGKDYAFTIQTDSSPQAFSLPGFADAGTLAPCSGGRPELVPVTQGGFKVENDG